MTKIYTTISPQYCHTWGTLEALRELFQENIDVQTMYNCSGSISYNTDEGVIVIKDEGPGIPISSFAMGMSDKRDHDDAIGQFGEGLKLACLVMARIGRKINIETVGVTLAPFIEKHPQLGCDVLSFTYEENKRTVGTLVKVEASPEEYEEARNLFLQLTDHKRYYVPDEYEGQRRAEKDDSILLPGGKIFVQGVLVSVSSLPEIDSFVFSYNFNAKDIQNRDRWAIDWNQITELVRDAWKKCSNPALIREYLTIARDGVDCIENKIGVAPYWYEVNEAGTKEIWQEIAKELFSDCVILDKYANDHRVLIEAAKALNYKVISLDWRLYELLKNLGIRTIKSLHEEISQFHDISVKDLDPEKRYIYREVKRLAKKYVFKSEHKNLEIIPTKFECDIVEGIPRDEKIRISVDSLDSLSHALFLTIHEYAHIKSGAGDFTSSFENELVNIACDIILKHATRRVS